jgi:hypothetical protein
LCAVYWASKSKPKVKPKPRISKVKKIQERTCWVVVTDEKMSKNVTQDVFSFMMDAELLVKWMRSWQGCWNQGGGALCAEIGFSRCNIERNV